MAHRLDPLLNPRSIAIVGASDNTPSQFGAIKQDVVKWANVAKASGALAD